MSLLLDTPTQERWRTNSVSEKGREVRQNALEREIWTNSISVDTDGGYDTSNLLAQMGRPLSSAEVRRRLHLCCPNLIFERALRYPELTGIYIMRDERNPAGGWSKKKIHICGMPTDGVMPEFSVLHKTKKKVANPDILGQKIDRDAVKWKEVETFADETRGWRTVLIRLLHQKIITRHEVDKHFGWNPSRDSEKWANLTR